MVYILQLDRPLGHAKFYVGYCKDNRLDARLKHHRKGSGASFTRACVERGIDFWLVAVFPNAGRDFERAIKNRKNTPKFIEQLKKQNSPFLVKSNPACQRLGVALS